MTALQDMKSWEDKASWARANRDASLAKVEPKLEGVPDELPLSSQDLAKSVLTPREIEITENYSVNELLAVLRERKISVEEVTRAFLRRAALAQAAVCSSPIPPTPKVERLTTPDKLHRGSLVG